VDGAKFFDIAAPGHRARDDAWHCLPQPFCVFHFQAWNEFLWLCQLTTTKTATAALQLQNISGEEIKYTAKWRGCLLCCRPFALDSSHLASALCQRPNSRLPSNEWR